METAERAMSDRAMVTVPIDGNETAIGFIDHTDDILGIGVYAGYVVEDGAFRYVARSYDQEALTVLVLSAYSGPQDRREPDPIAF